MENLKGNIEKIPSKIINFVENRIGIIPTIIETEYYKLEATKEIVEKNNMIWSDKFYDGENITHNYGLVKFNDQEVYIFFEKRKDDYTYKFYILCNEKNIDSIVFYLDKFKEYRTIK